jgi:hypothetical protein
VERCRVTHGFGYLAPASGAPAERLWARGLPALADTAATPLPHRHRPGGVRKRDAYRAEVWARGLPELSDPGAESVSAAPRAGSVRERDAYRVRAARGVRGERPQGERLKN